MKPDIIASIKSGDEKAFFNLYKLHREPFISWARYTFNIADEDIKDIYQEVFIALWQNVHSEKLTHLSSDIKTYVFSIGKHMIMNFIKKNNRTVTFEPSLLINEEYRPFEMTYNNDHNRIMVEEHLSKLDPKERRILEMYYMEEKDMKTIANELGYKTSDVAKKRKYEVFRKLALLVKTNLPLLLF